MAPSLMGTAACAPWPFATAPVAFNSSFPCLMQDPRYAPHTSRCALPRFPLLAAGCTPSGLVARRLCYNRKATPKMASSSGRSNLPPISLGCMTGSLASHFRFYSRFLASVAVWVWMAVKLVRLHGKCFGDAGAECYVDAMWEVRGQNEKVVGGISSRRCE